MSHVDASPLSAYNSLSDPHLAGYFANTKMRNHLRRSGLISRRGEIVSQNTYRLNMARKEHKKHVKDLLAHAIVQKTLDLERHRQVAIRQKLEEIAKIELVQRVKDERFQNQYDEALLPLLTPRKGKGKKRGTEKGKGQGRESPRDTGGQVSFRTPSPCSEQDLIIEERTHRQQRNDEDLLPYLSPRSSRPHSGPSPRSHRSNRTSKYRPISAPSNMPDTNSSMYESNDEDADVTYVDDDGNPIEWSEHSGNHGGRNRTPRSREEIDIRHLYSLNPAALRRYATTLARMEQTNSLISPYLVPQVPMPPSSPRSSSARHRGYRARSTSSDKSSKRSPGRDLHRQEPPMRHQGDIHSMCEVKMKYHGWALNLAREKMDPRQEIIVEQQHCGGNTLTVFRDLLVPGSTFSFTSKRHRGYPFSLTLYVDGRQDARVSTCCEMGHSKKVRLGGKQGHFSIVSIGGMTPCYKCQVQRGLKGGKAPPRKQKRPSNETGEEVIVVDTKSAETPSQKHEEAPPQEADDESADEQILVPVEPEGAEPGGATAIDEYEDDFDEENEEEKDEESDEVLYDKNWESRESKEPRGTSSNKRGVPEDVVEIKESPEDEDKRQIRGLADDFEIDHKGQKNATVPAEKSTKPSQLDEYEEDKNRKVEGYSSEEEDLEGERNKTVVVEKKENASGTGAATSNGRHEGPRERVRTPPKHPRILSLSVQQKEQTDPSEGRQENDKMAFKTRSPSPPQTTEFKITIKDEDRDADYSSSSESSSSSDSSSKEEEEETTPRPVTQGQENVQSKEKEPEPEPEEASKADQTNTLSGRSETSESSLPTSSSSSSSSDTDNKPASLPERPKSPVAMTLLKEEEEEQEQQASFASKEEKKEEEEKSPVVALTQEVMTQDEVEELGTSKQDTAPLQSTRSEPELAISRGGESVSPIETSSSSSPVESSSSSETEESTPRPAKTESPIQKTEATEEIQGEKKKSESEGTVSTSGTSSSSSSGSESERSAKEAVPSEESPVKKEATEKDSESDSSSQHEDRNQSMIIATAPAITTNAEITQAPAEAVEEQQQAKVEESVTIQGDAGDAEGLKDEEGKKKEESTSDTIGGVKKSEDPDSASVDSSSDSSTSGSSSSSSSSDEESETEGELIVQSDTPYSSRTQQSETDTVPKTDADTAAKTDPDTKENTDTDITARTEDNSRGEMKSDAQSEVEVQEEDSEKSKLSPLHTTPQPEQTAPHSPSSTPPHSPKTGDDSPLIPAVVVIPNTPEVSENLGVQEKQERAASPIERKASGPPDQLEYKSKHGSGSEEKASDDEGQQRGHSESEPETMHGGNDPDNVADNDSANWHGSMQFAAPLEQTNRQGSLTSLLDGHDDIQINNINLTKSQLKELLQALEKKETVHTLSISNANIGVDELQMLLESLAKSPSKPKVLNLNYNILGPSCTSKIVDILQIKPSIEMLLLQGNPISNNGLQTLVDGLLDIEYEAQEYKKKESERSGGIPITLPKGRFCQLQELDIGEASVTDEGMVDVALLLESNLELQTLSLSCSPDITQPGWNKLAASLAKNSKLKTLTLEHNKIGDAGMQVLADGLQNNTSLTTLELADSRLGEGAGRAILDLLKRNTTLMHLTLSPGNNIPDKTKEEIERYLALNQAGAPSPSP